MDRTISTQAIARVPFRHSARFIRRPPLGLFGEPLDDDAPSKRRFHVALKAHAPGGMAVSHGADVEILAIRADVEHVDVDLSWTPSGGSALFPSFTGTLRAAKGPESSTELVLHGSYRVPLGPIGRFGDGVVGHRVARQSVEDLLDRMAARIEERCLDASTRAQVAPAPYPPDMRHESRPTST